ncbi:class I SAM-dependent methyltransferase [Calothrix rhizosoleniae]|uniref:class I SAM-dependent methyltransferase n=1 Tax=Calothrix rhizosoleniae TaxID=888997 RepID=UPI000B49E48E|nr:class I SAM-dependent methyltransferase [Calothrix rhizosoleniae]
MFEEQPQHLQQKVKRLATEAVKSSEPSAWFEVLYADAQGDATQVPWAKLAPHPYLQDWLTLRKPSGQGNSALVIGCGLGDDAQALSELGFQVTAFDISPTAIAWCKQRFPNSTVNYAIADLLMLPQQWQNTFDLVIESRNIQALPLNVRSQAIQSVASMVAPMGTLLVITRFREQEAATDGPPWPLSTSELAEFSPLGLQESERVTFRESQPQEVQQLRIEYHKI